jgi:uncharacterized membrane protein
VARRRLALLVVWVAFLGDLLAGAGLLLSDHPALRTTGLLMLLAAVLAMVALTLWFYVQNRRGRQPPRARTLTEEQVP